MLAWCNLWEYCSSFGSFLVWPCGNFLYTCTHWHSVKDSGGPLAECLRLFVSVVLPPGAPYSASPRNVGLSEWQSLSSIQRDRWTESGILLQELRSGNHPQTESLDRGWPHLNCSLFSGIPVTAYCSPSFCLLCNVRK